jgi:CheY-like chemotaxis protein
VINCYLLFADDEPDIREIIAMSLERDPFFVWRACASGGEALAAASAWRPDLALLDVVMPEMDGPALLARLRADKATSHIPVVFLTACAQSTGRERLTALGAAGVITKPFDAMGLGAALRGFIPFQTVLAPAREHFLQRLDADARALLECRARLSEGSKAALTRIGEIAHGLAGAGGIYGFAGISREAALLSEAADSALAGRAEPAAVEPALARLVHRIAPAAAADAPRPASAA